MELDAPKLTKETVLSQHYGKSVLERTFRLPDGGQDIFFTFSGRTPVIILALTPKNEVIAVRQFRYGANEFVLELPGGVTERNGEACFEDVRRELLEETGYNPFNGIKHLGRLPVWFEPAAFATSFFPVLALDCMHMQEPRPEKTEILETVLIPLRQWIEMILCGEVCDSKSISTTFLALRILDFDIKAK